MHSGHFENLQFTSSRTYRAVFT